MRLSPVTEAASIVITCFPIFFTKNAFSELFVAVCYCRSNNFADMCCRLANLCSDWWQAKPRPKQLSVFVYVFGKPLRGTFAELAKSTRK